MNFLQSYYNNLNDHTLINAEQGSGFAKNIANDFNPIHNPDSKRFCVPGDLLFAIALQQYGLHQTMRFQFLDMVSADTPLTYPKAYQIESGSGQIVVKNDRDKDVLKIEYSGSVTEQSRHIEQLLRKYVAFSGMNFPHILVPLMKQHNVMINPKRPLVIYESMSLSFDRLEFESLDISLEETSLEVDGRRGTAKLHFSLNDNGNQIGTGFKTLVLSGLREYEDESIQEMCDLYESGLSDNSFQ